MSARPMTLEDHLRPLDHFIYVMWRDDEPLYVGMTSNYHKRLQSWAKHGGWVREATHIDVWEIGAGRDEARIVEADTIRALDPIHNLQFSPRVAERDRLWAEYSRWAQAYRDWWYDNTANAWALDQTTADRVCAAVGYVAPDIAAEQAAEWERLRRTINAIGPARHEAGAA